MNHAKGCSGVADFVFHVPIFPSVNLVAMPETLLLPLAIFAMALLYSSVGHGGASGYLAAMALLSVAPQQMRPAALCLNILVAGIAAVRFGQAGAFTWHKFWPFAVGSIPLAFLGGMLALPNPLYKQLVGVVLLFAAYRMFRFTSDERNSATERVIPLYVAVLWGAGIGLLSGLTGVGGGIFLSPLLLLMRWANVRETAGISAAFIFVNSIAGLMGNVGSVRLLPVAFAAWAVAAVVGGAIGSEFGRRRLANVTLQRLLAVVLIIAALKMIYEGWKV